VNLLEALRDTPNVIAAELRPPRAELEAAAGIDAWIDTYHAVRRLTREDTCVFLTDSAVGAEEEDNVRHLVTNLGADVSRERIVPFLTSKHSLDYCLSYADRARQHGIPALVVLGGDRHVGTPRCVEHAYLLRRAIRQVAPELVLGGWANPHADAATQARLVADPQFTAEFFLTQIVSHHRVEPVARFLRELERERVMVPGLFGVFFYRTANARTLAMLSRFLPVPVEELTREFEHTQDAVDVAARTVRAMLEIGARHFYVSNLPLGRAQQTLRAIVERAGVPI
jgi:5,10-methylenetetrahydrofolate reductase